MKKKLFIFFMPLTLLALVGCGKDADGPKGPTKVSVFSRPVVEKPEGGRKEWNDVSSFVCYYGEFDIEFQSKFDVVIMHSSVLYSDPEAKEKVQQLKDAGCWIVSYITIGEDDSLNRGDGLGEGGYASYYIYENGRPKMNENWGSYFVDAGNPAWQAKVIAETEVVLSYGVDGIFMDTLDSVDVQGSTLEGMVDLVRNLDKTFPEAKFVANRGFTALPYISQYIDGLMFESFNTTYNFELGRVDDLDEESNTWNEDVACNTINAVRRYDYFPVFVLDYSNEDEYGYMVEHYYNRSWQYDFIPYSTYDIQLGTKCYPTDAEGNMLTPTSKRGELALSKLSSSELENYNGDTSLLNLAYKDNGVYVKVDSTFTGYKLTPLNDGWYATDDNHVQRNWAKESWASTDAAMDHWVEFEWESAKNVSKVVVHWANDNGKYYSPKKCMVQAYINGEWVEVSVLTNEPEVEGDNYKANEQEWTFTFDSVTTTKIRVLQPKNCGAHTIYNDPSRAGIMWVSEIEIYE